MTASSTCFLHLLVFMVGYVMKEIFNMPFHTFVGAFATRLRSGVHEMHFMEGNSHIFNAPLTENAASSTLNIYIEEMAGQSRIVPTKI